MKIYVAASWRNEYQPAAVALLREVGREVYDFRNPAAGNQGFHWSEIGSDWKTWELEAYRDALKHPVAERSFGFDMDALRWADATVLVMPSGRSSHLELGWAAGAGKRTAIWYPHILTQFEPELMVKMADAFLVGTNDLKNWAGKP